MADHNPQHGRRQHFHRGRRGQDRRGSERRGPAPAQPAEQGSREHHERVDVEQIMREIRSRISQRHGIELTAQQIQELAARRLEAILDPRTVKPSLLEQIRRGTSTPLDTSATPEATYGFEDTTLYDSPRGSLRFIRRLLNPILKLFFNPDPLISALNAQAKLNQAAALREAERERRQAEWNALHYDILQRLVLEVSRSSLEAQQLSMRVDALSAKVDFAERRARSIEGTLLQARPSPRHEAGPPSVQPPQQPRESGPSESAVAATNQEGVPGEGGRRRRRRRRGRRPQGFTPEGAAIGAVAGATVADPRTADGVEPPDIDDVDEDEGGPDASDEGEPFEATSSPVDIAPAQPEPEAAQPEPEAVSSSVEALSPPERVPPTPPVSPSSETPPDAPAESAPADSPDRPRPTDPFGD